MKKSPNSLALMVVVLGTMVGAQARASVTYLVNETITGPINGVVGNPTQTDSVVGSITTDGTLGVLHGANLQSWDLNLIDVTNPVNSIELTQANSLISVDLGTVLNANAGGIFFDFTSTGAFAFQASSPGAASGFHYWCLSQGYFGCLDGNSIAPNNVYTFLAGDDLVVAGTGTQGQVGNSPLDQPPPPTGGVPEPAAWALMLAGFGGLGAVLRRRRRMAAA
jgi:hypothetical protein